MCNNELNLWYICWGSECYCGNHIRKCAPCSTRCAFGHVDPCLNVLLRKHSRCWTALFSVIAPHYFLRLQLLFADYLQIILQPYNLCLPSIDHPAKHIGCSRTSWEDIFLFTWPKNTLIKTTVFVTCKKECFPDEPTLSKRTVKKLMLKVPNPRFPYWNGLFLRPKIFKEYFSGAFQATACCFSLPAR